MFFHMKVIKWSVLFFLGYAVLAYLYIFVWANPTTPLEQIGTVADPSTFMNERELAESKQYASLQNFLYLLRIPFEFLVLLNILLLGVARKFDSWAQGISKHYSIQALIFTFYFSLLSFIIDFPISVLSYSISKSFGISIQGFSDFMREACMDFWISGIVMFLIVYVVYWLIRKRKKSWWFYAWLLSIPFALFSVFIQPVLIDPLYNDFSEIENKDLEQKILALAEQADIPADHVYQVEMSNETNAMNAYVTGIGSNARIVLWDTTLNGLTEEEILFIMAHEMSHYIHKDIYQNIAIQLLFTFFGLWAVRLVMARLEKKNSNRIKQEDLTSYASWPLILLVLSVLSFATDPVSNAISRHDERVCDAYAAEVTNNPEAGITTFQALSRNALSEVNPPTLIKWLRYSHPPLMERLATLDQMVEKKNQEQ